MTKPRKALTVRNLVLAAIGVGAVTFIAVFLLYFRNEPLAPVAFNVDHSQPFVIEIGRGSGRDGLNTLKITEDGTVEIVRQEHSSRNNEPPRWMVGSLHLPPAAVAKVVAAVNNTRVLALGPKHSSGVADGTQWIVRIRQGDHDKSMYFDNEFPPAVKAFTKQIDEILDANARSSVQWTPIENGERQPVADSLWKSIR